MFYRGPGPVTGRDGMVGALHQHVTGRNVDEADWRRTISWPQPTTTLAQNNQLAATHYNSGAEQAEPKLIPSCNPILFYLMQFNLIDCHRDWPPRLWMATEQYHTEIQKYQSKG